MDSDKVEVKQVTSGAKVESIGTVKTAVGEVKAIDPSGNERILQAGDKVYPNETIMTAVGALVLIEFVNGTHLDLPSSSQIVLDTDVFDPSLAKAATGELTAEQIQEMIARGEDPTAVTEATAAGAGAGDEGGSSFIVVDFNNTQGDVTSGFNTLGIPGPESTTFTELPPVEDEAIPPPAVPNISVSVEVDVQVGGGEPGEDGVVLIPGGTPITGGVSGAEVIEGSDGFSHSVTFLITLSQVATAPVTVTYTIVPDTATNPDDFFDGAVTGTVTIPAGFIGFTVTENIVADILVEGNETFQIVLSNPVGATLTNDTATVTIIDDDHPPVAIDDTKNMTEDQASVSGNLLTNDTDQDIPGVTGQTLSVIGTTPYTLTNAAGDTLQILNAAGDYIFTPSDATKAAAQSLDDGESTQVVFSDAYKVTDGANESNLADVTITITGANDAPVAVADTNWAQEDVADASGNVLQTLAHTGAPDEAARGDVADTDVDGEALTVTAFTGNIGHGTLTLGTNGAYTYVLDNSNAAVNALDDGETLTDTYTYTVTDGTTTNTAILTITIFGSNDAPVAVADTNWAQEDVANASGNVLQTLAHTGAPDEAVRGDVADTDVDGEALTVTAFTGNIGHGTLTLGTNGAYTYVLDNTNAAVQALDDGETLTDTYTYTVSDGTTTNTATLTITIFGSNDAPVAVADTNWAQEDVADASGNVLQTLAHTGAPDEAVRGDVADTDVDGEALTVTAFTGNIGHGTLTLGTNGAYTYVLDNSNAAVNALDDGETLTDTYTYTVTDGTTTNTATLTITIFGNNDTPTITTDSGNPAGANDVVYEAGLVAGSGVGPTTTLVNGTFTLSDPDGLDDIQSVTINGGVPIAIASLVGTTIIGPNGTLTVTGYDSGVATYTYQLTSPTSDGVGTETNVFTLTTSDGTVSSAPATITITIVDDVPQVSVTGSLPSLTVDETNLAINDTDSFANAFSFNYGADGAAASGAKSYSLGVNTSSLTGLVDTATNQEVVLSVNGSGVVEGRTAISNELVFTLSVDSTTGGAVLDQLRAIKHDVGVSSDTLNNANLITLTATITDGDNDPASATVDIGQSISFYDDGPSAIDTNGVIKNLAGQSLAGLINYDLGVDSAGSVTLFYTGPDLTSHGESVVFSLEDTNSDGIKELVGKADLDGDGSLESTILTLAVTGDTTPEDGSYALTLNDVIDLPVTRTTLLFDDISAGPAKDQVLVGGHLLIEDTDISDGNGQVKPSDFIGIDNNILNSGETIVYKFAETISGSSSPNYTITQKEVVNDLALKLFDTGSGSDTFTWVAFKDGLQVGTGTMTIGDHQNDAFTDTLSGIVETGSDTTSDGLIHVDGGYDQLNITVTSGNLKVGGVSYVSVSDPQDLNLTFGYTATDGDGDAVSGNVTATVSASSTTVLSGSPTDINTLLHTDNNIQP